LPEQTEEKEYYAREKKTWDAVASIYDISAPFLLHVRKLVVRASGVPAGSKVLDVATGTGQQAFAFARHGCDVTGIDLSESMLKMARRKNKYPGVKLQTADATSLPFEDKSFDVSSVSLALHDMPLTIREKTLKEMVRVTRSSIVIVEFGLPENKLWRFLIYNFVRSFEGDHYVKFIRSDFRASLKNAGIAIDREIRILFGGARIYKGSIIA
jgi:ubiquinone/menaquinone biosynthesis C-methylase UbiE